MVILSRRNLNLCSIIRGENYAVEISFNNNINIFHRLHNFTGVCEKLSRKTDLLWESGCAEPCRSGTVELFDKKINPAVSASVLVGSLGLLYFTPGAVNVEMKGKVIKFR